MAPIIHYPHVFMPASNLHRGPSKSLVIIAVQQKNCLQTITMGNNTYSGNYNSVTVKVLIPSAIRSFRFSLFSIFEQWQGIQEMSLQAGLYYSIGRPTSPGAESSGEPAQLPPGWRPAVPLVLYTLQLHPTLHFTPYTLYINTTQ